MDGQHWDVQHSTYDRDGWPLYLTWMNPSSIWCTRQIVELVTIWLKRTFVAQDDHEDLQALNTTASEYIMMIARAKRSKLDLYQNSHMYFILFRKDREMFENALILEVISIHPKSISLGHDYMQRTGPGRRGEHYHRNHIYSISGQNDIKDATSFVYGRSFFTSFFPAGSWPLALRTDLHLLLKHGVWLPRMRWW